MNVAIRKTMTREEFLAWEERQDLPFEFDGFVPLAMNGVTFAHAAIQANLLISLSSRLQNSPCRAVGHGMKIVAAGSIRYPDALIVCTPVALDATIILDPVVVFEILSPSTQATDRGPKNREYRATPSIQRYVMLEADRIMATIFHRDGEDWVGHVIYDDATLDLPEVSVMIQLGEFYAGLDLPEEPRADAGA